MGTKATLKTDMGGLASQLAHVQIGCTFQTFRSLADRGILTVEEAAGEICKVAEQLEIGDMPLPKLVAGELRILAARMEAETGMPAKH